MNIPAYPRRPHRSGQARIKIRGKDVWLGRWNSPESRTKYARLVAELAAAGGAPPPSVGEAVVSELVLAFLKWAELRYVKNGKQTTEFGLYMMAVAPVVELYDSRPVNSFGPLALMACRDALVAKGYCRKKINEHLGRIRRVFKWGVSRELVKESTWSALRSVEGLRKGEAHDLPKVTCVAPEAIAAIERHVLPPVWAMIQLQLWTAMRPGEVTIMRTCDIVADDPAIPAALRGKCWLYRPLFHKTEHHEKSRLIFLGPQAQEILRAWMRPDSPETFLFSPAEAVEFRRADRKAKAKAPRRNFKRKAKPKKKPKSFYEVTAYSHSISKACKKVGIPAWGPNRLRHNAATLIRERYGIEVSRIICGHASIATTEIYAEADVAKAAAAIADMG